MAKRQMQDLAAMGLKAVSLPEGFDIKAAFLKNIAEYNSPKVEKLESRLVTTVNDAHDMAMAKRKILSTEYTPARTTFSDRAVLVFDTKGEARIRMGTWDETEEPPKYNDNSDSEANMTINLNNPDIVAQRLLRDKAIIAMHILRVTKPKNSKGIGPNREDHPLFREVVNNWLNKGPVDAEMLAKIEQARERVTKYTKQLDGSIYLGPIESPTFMRHEMLESVTHAYKQQAEAELAEALKEHTYGGW